MANVSQRSFSAGEISPAMYARSDMERYATALRTLRNAVVLRTGGVQSRAGTEYLGSTKANGAARLVGAVFDTTANYVLEFGNLYVRFWKDGAPITATVTGAWANTTAYTAGIVVSYSGVNYVCLVAHTSVTATDRPSTGSSWQTKWYALTGTTYELPTPYTEAQLFDVQFAFQLDVVTVAHASHSIATLTRISNNVWDYAVVSLVEDAKVPQNVAVSGASGSGWGYTVAARFFADGVFTQGPANPVVRTDETATTLLAFGLSGDTRTITWNSVTDAVSYRVYLNSPGGTEWRYVNTPDNSTTFSSFSAAWLSAQEGEPTTATSNFDQPGEYPGVVAAYQQRLLVAGKTDFPDVVYASQVAEPYNFTGSSPIVDSDAMSWRQVGRRLNRVRHFVEAAQRLFQFSDVGESIVQGDTDGILRPGEVNPRQFSENGAAVRPAPLVVNDTALYVQARGSMVRDLAPIQVGGFAGSDLTLQAAHLVDGYELVDWCYQQTPHSVVWAVRDDGQLLSLTYVRELGILGWAHHDTLGEIESVCCVPEGTLDAVYAVVKRTIDGNTVRYVERFYDRLDADPILMDCAVVAEAP